MSDLPKANTLAQIEALHGKPVAVSTFAFMVHRSRRAIYNRIERGTLPACYVGGLLCVLVNGEGGSQPDNSPALGNSCKL